MTDDDIQRNLMKRNSGYVVTTTTEVRSERRTFTKKNLGIHPDYIGTTAKYTDHFYFSQYGKRRMNVSLGISSGATVSFSINVSAKANSGWRSDKGNRNRPSKPMMYGTGYTTKMKVVERDRYSNRYIRTYYVNICNLQAEGAKHQYY